MLSKEELLEKNVSELEEIAQQTGAVYSPGDDKDKLVYAILDRQAEEVGTAHPLESKRKRTRIARKETDRVYSVHGKNGENFDVKNNKPTGVSQPTLLKILLKKLLRRRKRRHQKRYLHLSLNIVDVSQKLSLKLLLQRRLL